MKRFAAVVLSVAMTGLLTPSPSSAEPEPKVNSVDVSFDVPLRQFVDVTLQEFTTTCPNNNWNDQTGLCNVTAIETPVNRDAPSIKIELTEGEIDDVLNPGKKIPGALMGKSAYKAFISAVDNSGAAKSIYQTSTTKMDGALFNALTGTLVNIQCVDYGDRTKNAQGQWIVDCSKGTPRGRFNTGLTRGPAANTLKYRASAPSELLYTMNPNASPPEYGVTITSVIGVVSHPAQAADSNAPIAAVGNTKAGARHTRLKWELR